MGKKATATPSSTVSDLLALYLAPGVGHATASAYLAQKRQSKEPLARLLGQPLREIMDFLPPGCVPLATAMAACGPGVRARGRRLLKRLELRGIQAVARGTAGYPEVISATMGAGAPPLLHFLGDPSLLATRQAGIVGARRPTHRGRTVAARCARHFAHEGIPVVSGGARGVDTTAHEATLEESGATIAVLPLGLLRHPRCARLTSAAKQGKALLVSACLPTAPWHAYAAVHRNGIIAALASILCVVEPRKTGGSVCTARHGLALGRPVLYVPAPGVRPPFARHSIAVPLLGPDGRVAFERLRAAWAAPPLRLPSQSLFL